MSGVDRRGLSYFAEGRSCLPPPPPLLPKPGSCRLRSHDQSILEPRDEDGDGGGGGGDASDDPLYDRAVACVAQAGYCSIRHIQRQLKVGCSKAATLLERMEKEGDVGFSNGKAGGRREVLIQSM